MKRRTAILAGIAAPTLLGTSHLALAQEYPTRAIRVVSPSPPGGGGDVSNRVITKHMADLLGQPVVVDNKVGGNGVVAAMEALRGGPDGYTIYAGSNTTLAAIPYLMKSTPYDPSTDFMPVALQCTIPFILVVNPDLPVKSVKDLIAYAKAQPGKVTYASANASSLVAGSMLARVTGMELLNVPYKSAPASMNDIVSGRVSMAFVDIPSSLGLIQAGKLRVVGISSAKRAALMPQVPAIAETVPGYELVGWTAMCLPAGTSPAIAKRLHDVINKVLVRPDVKDQLAKVGFDATTMTLEEFASFMRTERTRWARMIRSAGIQPE